VKRKLADGIRNVEGEFIIATLMRSYLRRSDPKRSRLTCALKVQDRPSIGEWVLDGDSGAVPSLTTKVWLVRVARIVAVETVWQFNCSPKVALRRIPWLTGPVNTSPPELPPMIDPIRRDNRHTVRRHGLDGDRAKGRSNQTGSSSEGCIQQELPSGRIKQGASLLN
jgi:hypothetical protein